MRISLLEAVTRLAAGEVVALPTETVYGLAAALHCQKAIERVFTLKKRPHVNPLIIHVASIAEIETYATAYPPSFEALAHTFWPGPLTCILPVCPTVPSTARAALPTAGFRIPAPTQTRHVLSAVGPLVMPSANLSGRPSATLPEHVEADFGAAFPVLDGGPCLGGLESTILLYQEPEWVIARLGALTAEQFTPLLGYKPRFLNHQSDAQPLCPGQLFRHYAPRASLSLCEDPEEAPFILGFQEREYPPNKRLILLGSLKCPEEVAANLYRALRQLDVEKATYAWVDMDFPRQGLWQVIAERLFKAGAPTQ